MLAGLLLSHVIGPVAARLPRGNLRGKYDKEDEGEPQREEGEHGEDMGDADDGLALGGLLQGEGPLRARHDPVVSAADL